MRRWRAATQEVLYVDDTLHRVKWQTLLQHFALRRVYWGGSYTADRRVALFAGQQVPAIRDYLKYFQADPSDLVSFLHACMLNKLDASALCEELRAPPSNYALAWKHSRNCAHCAITGIQ